MSEDRQTIVEINLATIIAGMAWGLIDSSGAKLDIENFGIEKYFLFGILPPCLQMIYCTDKIESAVNYKIRELAKSAAKGAACGSIAVGLGYLAGRGIGYFAGGNLS